MQTRVEILWGQQDSDSNELPLHVKRTGYDLIANELCKHFGGFTSYNGMGGWVDPANGKVYREPTVVFFADVQGTISEKVVEELRLFLAGLAFWSSQSGINLAIRGGLGSSETVEAKQYAGMLVDRINNSGNLVGDQEAGEPLETGTF